MEFAGQSYCAASDRYAHPAERDTVNLEECSLGVFIEMLPGHLGFVVLTDEKSKRNPIAAAIPIELLLIPEIEEIDNESIFEAQ